MSAPTPNWRDTIGSDVLASVVVFLVALPLCMGISIASGMPPATGIVTGIIGGLIVGFIAGSPLQVSGPAAGLAVMVWQIVDEHGFAVLGAIVLVAGGIQIAAGVAKLGQWFRAVAPAVIRGMLAGIGVLIFASQFHVMVDDYPKGGGLDNLLSIPGAVLKGVIPSENTAHHYAAGVGLLTIIVIVAWDWLKPKKLKAVPGPLLAVIVASGAAAILDLPIVYIDIPSDLTENLTIISFEGFTTISGREFAIEALAVAFIASAETLLCATAVDQMHSGPRTRYDRELTAQGVGNVLCGILGALPMTGVIVRSSANVDAGAKTRMSAILHGVWLLAFVVALPSMLAVIPRSSLAAILVHTGYKLAHPKAVRELVKYGWPELLVYSATLAAIVAVDLLTGVLLGVLLSVIKLLYRISHLEAKVTERGGVIDLHLSGSASFLSLPKLASTLENLPMDKEVHVHIQDLAHIDHACLDLLKGQAKRQEEAGGKLEIEWDELFSRYGAQGDRAPDHRTLDGS